MNLRSILPLFVLLLLVILFAAVFSTKIFGQAKPEFNRDPITPDARGTGICLINYKMWIRNFNLRSLRQQISFVLQDTLLFRAPIWQNIAYGNPEVSRDEIVRAARLANAEEFIERMPEGYDTMAGERGVTLSGGQRQRIAIARAIIRNSPILILDEPTSGLDAESEELVFDALRHLMQGKTSVVVSHRLATITRADMIFVVKNGRIAEEGTTLELLRCGGLYAQLHQIQFRHEEVATAF